MDADIVESAATPEQQEAALKIGWKPADQYKGPADKFVDADAYLERAETVLPFVRAHNQRLSADLADLRSRLETVISEKSDLSKRLEDIDMENSTRLAKEVKRVRDETQAELEAALEAGDHKLSAKLTRDVAKLEALEDEPPAKKADERPAVSAPDQKIIADWNAWAAEVDYDKWSVREQAEFRAAGEIIRRKGNMNIGRAFLDDVVAALEKDKKVETRQESRVEPGKGSGSPRGGKKTGYESLSAEERAVCDSDERKFVGAGKKFAKAEDYRAFWATKYLEQA